MNNEEKKEKLKALRKYLNKDWQGIGHDFIERMVARIEYDKLLAELTNS